MPTIRVNYLDYLRQMSSASLDLTDSPLINEYLRQRHANDSRYSIHDLPRDYTNAPVRSHVNPEETVFEFEEV